MTAIQQHCIKTPYDSPFIYASVDADIVRLVVRNGAVVGKSVVVERVGQLICTKRIDSDSPEDLTQAYKCKKSKTRSPMLDNR